MQVQFVASASYSFIYYKSLGGEQTCCVTVVVHATAWQGVITKQLGYPCFPCTGRCMVVCGCLHWWLCGFYTTFADPPSR
jgi:hypothetical protein